MLAPSRHIFDAQGLRVLLKPEGDDLPAQEHLGLVKVGKACYEASVLHSQSRGEVMAACFENISDTTHSSEDHYSMATSWP